MDIRNYYNIQLIEFVVIFKLFFNGIIMIRKLILRNILLYLKNVSFFIRMDRLFFRKEKFITLR